VVFFFAIFFNNTKIWANAEKAPGFSLQVLVRASLWAFHCNPFCGQPIKKFKTKCINSSKNAIFTYMYSVNSNIPTFRGDGLNQTIAQIISFRGYYILQLATSNYIGNQKFIK
jgi:hypothetical protein